MIEKLASAFATMEGFFVQGSLPQRNHNPGNLRASFLERPKDKRGFVRFASREEGIAALIHQLAKDIARGLTLRQLISKYAPPNENNTENYIRETARRVGIDADTPLWTLLHVERMP